MQSYIHAWENTLLITQGGQREHTHGNLLATRKQVTFSLHCVTILKKEASHTKSLHGLKKYYKDNLMSLQDMKDTHELNTLYLKLCFS